VAFVPVAGEKLNDGIDLAYQSKDESHGADYLGPMVRPEARATTIMLTPRSTTVTS
jgi:hypothetical protein